MSPKIHLVALTSPGSFSGVRGTHATGRTAATDLIGSVVEIAKKAEGAAFDAVLLADFVAGPAQSSAWKHRTANFVDPVVLSASIINETSHIGVIPTLSSSFEHPYSIARQVLSLDLLSGGRVGWNVVTSMAEGAHHSHGLDAPPSHSDRYSRARESVEIANALWDSFDEFGSTDDVFATHYEGSFIRTHSVLGLPRSPQGRPVIVQAGQSEDGLDFAAQYADAVFVGKDSREGVKAVRDALIEGGAVHGRRTPALALSSLGFVIAETHDEALTLEAQAQSRTSVESRLLNIEKYFEADQWTVDPTNLDVPLPPFPEHTELRQTGLEYYRRVAAERDDWTVREFLHRTRGGHMLYFVGSYSELADEIERFASESAADGFVLSPRAGKTQQFDAFIRHVLPELRHRGLVRDGYTGTTLRDHLALDKPLRSSELLNERTASYS